MLTTSVIALNYFKMTLKFKQDMELKKLTVSGALTLASLSSNNVAIEILPCVAAKCSGVVKFTSTTFVSAP